MRKILILSFFLCFSLMGNAQQGHFNKQIGTVVDGNVTLTMSQAQILSRIQSHLTANNVIVTLTSASVHYIGDNSYNIVVTNQSGSIATALELILDDGKLYEARSISGGGYTVTCSACVSGCEPKAYKGITNCTACTSGETCTKTETVSTGSAIL